MPRMRAGSIACGMNTAGSFQRGSNTLNRLSAPVGQRPLSHSVFDLNQGAGQNFVAPGFDPLRQQQNQMVNL